MQTLPSIEIPTISRSAVTFRQAIDMYHKWATIMMPYNTATNYTATVRRFMNDLMIDERTPDMINEIHIKEYLDFFCDKRRLGTINTKIAALRNFYKFCVAKGLSRTNPAMIVSINHRLVPQRMRLPKASKAVTIDDINAMREQSVLPTFWHYELIEFCYWTGMRMNDALSLTRDSVNDGVVHVMLNKRKRVIAIDLRDPMFGRALEILESLPITGNESDKYFFSPLSKVFMSGRKNTIPMSFSRAFRRTAIKDKTFHGTRKAFIQRMKDNGKDLESIGKIVGHSNVDTTWGYAY